MYIHTYIHICDTAVNKIKMLYVFVRIQNHFHKLGDKTYTESCTCIHDYICFLSEQDDNNQREKYKEFVNVN